MLPLLLPHPPWPRRWRLCCFRPWCCMVHLLPSRRPWQNRHTRKAVSHASLLVHPPRWPIVHDLLPLPLVLLPLPHEATTKQPAPRVVPDRSIQFVFLLPIPTVFGREKRYKCTGRANMRKGKPPPPPPQKRRRRPRKGGRDFAMRLLLFLPLRYISFAMRGNIFPLPQKGKKKTSLLRVVFFPRLLSKNPMGRLCMPPPPRPRPRYRVGPA